MPGYAKYLMACGPKGSATALVSSSARGVKGGKTHTPSGSFACALLCPCVGGRRWLAKTGFAWKERAWQAFSAERWDTFSIGLIRD